jgi:hypothetical protein
VKNPLPALTAILPPSLQTLCLHVQRTDLQSTVGLLGPLPALSKTKLPLLRKIVLKISMYNFQNGPADEEVNPVEELLSDLAEKLNGLEILLEWGNNDYRKENPYRATFDWKSVGLNIVKSNYEAEPVYRKYLNRRGGWY